MAQCWKYKSMVISAFIFGIIDLVVTTVTFGHGVDYRLHFIFDVYQYDIYTSLIELWVFGLVRFTLLFGGVAGFARNPAVAVPRILCIKPVITALLVTMWVYTNTKLLLYVEKQSDLRQPWFWSLYGWSNTALIAVYFLWAIFTRQKVTSSVNQLRMVVNDDENRILIDAEEQPDNGEDNKEADDKEKPSSLRTVGRLLKLSLPDWYIILIAFIFMTISSSVEVFIPYYTGQVIQGIVINKSQADFVKAIIIMSVLAVISTLAAGLRGGFFNVSMARFRIRVCNRLFSALMQQEVAFYDVTRTGDITSRLTSDTTTMCEALSMNTNIFLRNLFEIVGNIVFMTRLSWRLTMVSFIGLPLLMGVSEVYGEFYKNLCKEVQDLLAKANEVAEEAFSSIRTVRSFANELSETGRYAKRLQATYKLKVKEAAVFAGYVWVSDFFELSLVVATLYYGGHLVMVDQMSGGDLVSFILYQMQFGFCLESMADVYTGLMQSVGASEKVFEFLDRKPVIPQESGKLAPEKLTGLLEFKDVSFSYPARPDIPVLKNVSFSVSPGEVVALVGPSGGGKSTIVGLLEHFYETDSGHILLDGLPIQDYDHKYLHTQVSLVGQEPVLYARSVKENIMYGLEDVTPDQVEAAAKQANAHGFISEMKDKYDTLTGEKGIQLSGGQKQRVAIARALVRKPVVLLLDEATSALDSESEHLVQEALYNNLKGRTVIIIAHRLSTVERANRIIVINKGKIEEEGTHSQLLQSEGLYSRLARRQMLAFDTSLIPQGETAQ